MSNSSHSESFAYPPAPPFAGSQGRTVPESRPAWLAGNQPPEGAPNVIVMLVDDLGYSDIGCFGSEIPTPNLDRLAEQGVRYTNFHVAPLCSPTRASLLTGVNSHAAGVATVTNSGDSGFPGNRGELADDVVSAAEVFRANGYATLMVGKWHLTSPLHLADGSSKASWPLQRGFDRFYGFIEEGFTSYHHPNMLVADNHMIEIDEYPPDYYLTDDLTDQAVTMIRRAKSADPRTPFFLYYAHGACHAPLHAKPDDMALFSGKYAEGWDRLRQARFARQRELGIIADDTRLPGRNTEASMDVDAWDDLSPDEQLVFARYMEAYAAMVKSIDDSLGALVDTVEALGELDNTVIIFTADNGASKEGGALGTTEYLNAFAYQAVRYDSFERDLQRIDWIGGPRCHAHYPRGWAMAGNTPFRLYKITTFAGALTVPFIMSWPDRVAAAGEIRRQYTHVTDVLPTLIDMIGLDRPEQRHGIAAQPMNGVSFQPTIDDDDAPTAHNEQYYEHGGHLGFYRDGWEAIVFRNPGAAPFGDPWQLFHVGGDDPTQIDDVAAEQPERLADLVAGWEQAAHDNNVFPVGGPPLRAPAMDALADTAVRLTPDDHTLERFRAWLLIFQRSFDVEVELDFADGDQGVLFAHGDQAGGYSVYVEDGQLVYAHNAFGAMTHVRAAMPAGGRRVTVRIAAPGELRWDVRLLIDGAEVGSADGLQMLCGPMSPFEGFDVGVDRRSPVDWDVFQRHGAFAFTGRLDAVTITPGEYAPDANERKTQALREKLTRFD